MGVRIGVVVFPGSNCDRDTVHALDLGAIPNYSNISRSFLSPSRWRAGS